MGIIEGFIIRVMLALLALGAAAVALVMLGLWLIGWLKFLV